MLVFVVIARLFEVDWTALDDKWWFPYAYVNGVLICLRYADPLNRILPDGTEEWYDGEEEIRMIYCKTCIARGMTETFAKATRLRYIYSGGDCFELQSLEMQDALVTPRQSPNQTVGVGENANKALDFGESRIECVLDDDDGRDFEGADGLNEVERVCVKEHIRYLHEFCCIKRRKVPSTVAEAVEVADEFLKHGSESEGQVANDTVPVM